jgi:hypothetical protein
MLDALEFWKALYQYTASAAPRRTFALKDIEYEGGSFQLFSIQILLLDAARAQDAAGMERNTQALIKAARYSDPISRMISVEKVFPKLPLEYQQKLYPFMDEIIGKRIDDADYEKAASLLNMVPLDAWQAYLPQALNRLVSGYAHYPPTLVVAITRWGKDHPNSLDLPSCWRRLLSFSEHFLAWKSILHLAHHYPHSTRRQMPNRCIGWLNFFQKPEWKPLPVTWPGRLSRLVLWIYWIWKMCSISWLTWTGGMKHCKLQPKFWRGLSSRPKSYNRWVFS